MGKKLAIKGHPTRGKEVIKLLEMMGGSNIHNLSGNNSYVYYVNDGYQNIIRGGEYIFGDEDMYFFTLEEFLEKFPYKVGDKVHIYVQSDDIDGRYDIDAAEITSIKWNPAICKIAYKMKNINREFYKEEIKCKADDSNKSTNKKTDNIKLSDNKCERTHEDVIFDSIIWHLRNSVNNGKQNLSGGECEDYFREVVKKNNENKMKNVLAELLEHIKTTPKEELEKEFNELEDWSNVGPTVEEFMTFCESVNKKPKYPTTYDECKAVMQLQDSIIQAKCGYEYRLISYFQQLLMCRDAYWKIAGEELGLGKPWEPNWTDGKTKYGLTYYTNFLIHSNCVHSNKILVFPSDEMRDAFYENFKYLIEACKELL